MTLCELLPTRRTLEGGRSLPELLFFVEKMTHQANINCRTLLVALIYLQRAKSHLPRRAVGCDHTAHRMFLGALLVASKFLKDSAWTTDALTNRSLFRLCNGLFSMEDIYQLERAFLKLIRYNCWVDDKDLDHFVLTHRQDLLI
ncbi:cyclin domain-containing protein [Sporodiniella umbellata]|nr:cyclin domain-containing protein [Sporodiniella umbellata]